MINTTTDLIQLSKKHTMEDNDACNQDDKSEKIKDFSFDPLQAKASFKQPPTSVLPFLYIGTQYNASDKYIKDYKFHRILNLKDTHYSDHPKGIKFLHIPMSDYGDSDVFEVGKSCFSFIDSARKNNENILVHCRGGLNRSPTIVIAYLMVKLKMTLNEAYYLVKNKREKITPHKNYIDQLKLYEKKTRGVVTLVDDYTPSLQDRIEQYRKDHITNNKAQSHPAVLKSSPLNLNSDIPPKLKIEKKSKTSPIDSLPTKKKKDRKKKPKK